MLLLQQITFLVGGKQGYAFAPTNYFSGWGVSKGMLLLQQITFLVGGKQGYAFAPTNYFSGWG